MSSNEWQFPAIAVGDDVLMSRDQSRSDMTYAKVVRVKPQAKAIDVVAFFDGGPVIFTHLWHKDDPRILTEADRFTNSCSGVFALSESVTARISMLARMDTLEKRFTALERYVAGETIPDPAKTLPPVAARPRGRPRLNPIASEAAV